MRSFCSLERGPTGARQDDDERQDDNERTTPAASDGTNSGKSCNSRASEIYESASQIPDGPGMWALLCKEDMSEGAARAAIADVSSALDIMDDIDIVRKPADLLRQKHHWDREEEQAITEHRRRAAKLTAELVKLKAELAEREMKHQQRLDELAKARKEMEEKRELLGTTISFFRANVQQLAAAENVDKRRLGNLCDRVEKVSRAELNEFGLPVDLQQLQVVAPISFDGAIPGAELPQANVNMHAKAVREMTCAGSSSAPTSTKKRAKKRVRGGSVEAASERPVKLHAGAITRATQSVTLNDDEHIKLARDHQKAKEMDRAIQNQRQADQAEAERALPTRLAKVKASIAARIAGDKLVTIALCDELVKVVKAKATLDEDQAMLANVAKASRPKGMPATTYRGLVLELFNTLP